MRLHTLSIVIEFFCFELFVKRDTLCTLCHLSTEKRTETILSNLSKAVVSLNYLTYLLLNVI